MFRYKTGKLATILISALLLTLFSMCEDFEDETFTVNETDGLAIEVFKDTNTVMLDNAKVTVDSAGEYTLTYNEFSAEYSDYVDVIDFLDDSSLTVSPGETHYEIKIAKDKQNSMLMELGSEATLVFYTDANVNVELVDATDTPMDGVYDFPVELAAGYFEIDENQSQARPEPVIQNRAEFELTSGTYVLKLLSTEATEKYTFSLVVIEKQ